MRKLDYYRDFGIYIYVKTYTDFKRIINPIHVHHAATKRIYSFRKFQLLCETYSSLCLSEIYIFIIIILHIKYLFIYCIIIIISFFILS